MLRAFGCLVTFFLFVGLLMLGIDYGYHGIAVMTHDARWNTDSYNKDRLMNGLTLTTVYRTRPDASMTGQASTMFFTFENSSEQTKKLNLAMITCISDNDNGESRWEEMLPNSWIIEPYQTVTYSMPVVGFDGVNKGSSFLNQGEVPCKLTL